MHDAIDVLGKWIGFQMCFFCLPLGTVSDDFSAGAHREAVAQYEVDTRDPRDFLAITLERMIDRQARDLGVGTVHPMFLTLSQNTLLG
jgi:hypothetical protein